MIVMKIHKSPDLSLVGQKIGKLTVVSFSHRAKYRNQFMCKCDCGKDHLVPEIALKLKNTRSCGCLQKERASEVKTTHGGTKGGKMPPEYTTLMAMIARCTNPKHVGYKHYGAAGITVCEEWRGSTGFPNFLKCVGPKPGKGWSIGRIDNSKGYEPGNVRWETATQQAQNRSICRYLTHNGETHCLTEWARKLGMQHSTLRVRIENHGVEKALSTPRPAKGWFGSKTQSTPEPVNQS